MKAATIQIYLDLRRSSRKMKEKRVVGVLRVGASKITVSVSKGTKIVAKNVSV